MPVGAIDDARVLAEVVGLVAGIRETSPGVFSVRIALAVETTGGEIGQLVNMLFGNSSIHDDLNLEDVELPDELLSAFPGPGHGLAGLRQDVGASGRALTGSALKPQGLPARSLGELAERLARGGLDAIKDDHGLADQRAAPFADRVAACAEAVARANAATGGGTLYWPSLSGDLDRLRRQVETAQAAGIIAVLVAPMILGLPTVAALVRDYPRMRFMAHPAMAGAARIAPPLLLGKLFRLIGADATVFPNHGGRFGYSRETCLALAAAALGPWGGLKPCVPVAAGGMTLDRVPEMLEFYGSDVMLLIGGGLLAARERLTAETARFVEAVSRHA
ncbi:MAG TPA: RuBisCO large subunit C-terminal-like domain-containing protein [Stellaceae bacterium]|nr:RuBisCO large subunit C-terminal-like domain-containing protein [Stellaceae bacterium]